MTNSIKTFAPAKLNLFLELLSRRKDGYHELETVMVCVGLFDQLIFRKRFDKEIRISCSLAYRGRDDRIPIGRDNLVWRAVDGLRTESGTRFGVDVSIQKNIPTMSGLGGGSSDAVAALLSVNKLFRLQFKPQKLIEMANQLGSDLAFFFSSPAAVATGRGERVEPIRMGKLEWFVVAMPPTGLSTRAVYESCQLTQRPHSSRPMIDALQTGDRRAIGRMLLNRLQAAAEQLSPWIKRLSSEFSQLGAMGHQMSGSGASYFGLFSSRSAARLAERKLSARVPEARTFCVRGLGYSSCQFQHIAE